jgi:Putative transmembrane protein precursor.
MVATTAAVGESRPPILVKKNQKMPQTEGLPSDDYAVVVRCSCHSIWCPKCFRKYFAGKESARMQRMDWRRTRKVTLTLNPANWVDGEDAYMWFKLHKPIGHFIENLGRAGVKVTDWTCNMEWHDNGYPHWHLLIEVDKPGRKGMIGQELLHELWAWGEKSHRIHEGYFETEQQFKEFTGYFAKSGYLHKDKQHQMILPDWASGQGWAGMKINRFSSKRSVKSAPELSTDAEPEKAMEAEARADAEPVDAMESEAPADAEAETWGRPYRNKRTYAVKHGRCGNQVELWEVEYCQDGPSPRLERTYLGRYSVPYDLVVNGLAGNFYEGIGFSLECTVDFANELLKSWERSPPAPPGKRSEYKPSLPAYMIGEGRGRHFYSVFGPFMKGSDLCSM